jgi:two-component system, NtrC family, sensor histidine kinase PilS
LADSVPTFEAPDVTVERGKHIQLGQRDLLRWLYLGRLTLLAGILVGAFVRWRAVAPDTTRLATVMFLVALAVTATSFWYTHVLGREPNKNFMYAQVILDVILVTGIVHITQGPDSSFAPVYILVISAGALLLPLPGGVLIGGLASMAYFADLVWGFQVTLNPAVGAQIGLFTIVALITGLLGDRLRQAGLTLGEVASELQQLRLDTGDILANLATGVLTVDGSGRLVYANAAAETLLGLPLTATLGEPVLGEVERVAPGLGGVLEGSAREGRPVRRFRTSATLSGGRRVRLGVSTTVLGRPGEESDSVTAIFQDITDLERIDELNLRTERLEAVAALSASLAHEIKNPLASIRSSVEQLGGDRVSSSDRSVLERLVLNESDRLSRLLSEFLNYSGIEAGPHEDVDLSDLVRRCAALAQQHPDFEGVDLSVELPEKPVCVMGDVDLLHQALFNLLLNGAQSAGPEGKVIISAAAQATAVWPRGVEMSFPRRVSVRDSGPGVDPKKAARIFDPFFTTRGSGSGLGLAVVHRAVEAHQGVTLVETAPEGGAQFVIYLPGLPGEATRGGE